MKTSKCAAELGYPLNQKDKPTGPLANQSVSGVWNLADMLSDESLAALYRVSKG